MSQPIVELCPATILKLSLLRENAANGARPSYVLLLLDRVIFFTVYHIIADKMHKFFSFFTVYRIKYTHNVKFYSRYIFLQYITLLHIKIHIKFYSHIQ